MAWNLASIVPEVLGDITRSLSAEDIAKLYLTGSATLRRSLEQPGTVKRFTFQPQTPQQLRWPSIVRYFLWVENFEYQAPKELRHLVVEGVNLADIPRNVKHVELGFLNGFASLWALTTPTSEPVPRNIKELWPRLEHLSYQPQGAQRVALHEDIYPDTLSFLNLRHEFSVDHFKLVPRSLLELCVDLASNQDWNIDPQFPPHLTSLTINQVASRQILDYLPTTLQTLNLSYVFRLAYTHAAEKEMLEKLPSSLTSLSITVQKFSLEVASALPRSLKSLVISLIDPKDQSYVDADFTAQFLKALPPHLTTLTCHTLHSHLRGYPENQLMVMQALPKTLLAIPEFVGAIGLSIERQTWAELPPSLTRLDIRSHRLNRWECAQIPRTVTELSVGRLWDEEDDPLLRLAGMTGALLLTETVQPWSFPPRLSTVTITDAVTPAALHALVSQCRELDNFEFQLAGPTYLDMLPDSLTHLGIICRLGEKLPSLARFTNLRSLKATQISGNDSNFISTLPSSLKSLHLRWTARELDMATFDFSHLTRLRTLELSGWSMLNLTGGVFAPTLPSSLTRLRLAFPDSHLTRTFAATLPSSLTSLDAPANFTFDGGLENLRNLASFETVNGSSLPGWDEFNIKRAALFSQQHMYLVYPFSNDDE